MPQASYVDRVRELLEDPGSLPLYEDEGFTRLHDDHDGTFEGELQLILDRAGDMRIFGGGRWLRFRSYFGGGMSLRTWSALRILAYAIKLDNQDRPQERPDTD